MHLPRIVVIAVLLGAAGAAVVHSRSASGALNPPAIEHIASSEPLSFVSPMPIETPAVYVAGEVAHPGVYGVPRNARLIAAIRAAGGANSRADLAAVNLAEHVQDGQEIFVPAIGAMPLPLAAYRDPRSSDSVRGSSRTKSGSGRKRRVHRNSAGSKSGPSEPIDINAADVDQIEGLPGMDPPLAARIVADRRLNGSFTKREELLDIAGMTRQRLDAISADIVIQ